MSTSRTPTLNPTPNDWLPAVEALVREAGALVMTVYAGDFAVRGKADASPVTLADELAEALITARLLALAPGVPVVAEEAVSAGRCAALADPMAPFWLVDPLDGTREFVARNGEFTVNVGLVVGGVPVLGVVLAPAWDSDGAAPGGRLYAGLQGQGAWEETAAGRRPIAARAVPAAGLTVVASRSHGDETALDALLAGQRVASRTNAGSSLKLCLLAAGQADLYPRLGRTMEWDIAAGHAVLAAAGGEVCRLDGTPLGYGKPGFENPHFVAMGATRSAWPTQPWRLCPLA